VKTYIFFESGGDRLLIRTMFPETPRFRD